MTPYDILGVEPDATPEEILKAYRRKAMELHPDRGGDRAVFQAMKDAYELLSDPARRQLYDDTGETRKPNDRRAQAESLVVQLAMEALQREDLDTDLLGKMRTVVVSLIFGDAKSYGELGKTKAKTVKAQARFRRKGGKDNLINEAFQQVIDNCDRQMADLDEHKLLLEEVLNVLDEYTYGESPDEGQPRSALWLSGGDFV